MPKEPPPRFEIVTCYSRSHGCFYRRHFYPSLNLGWKRWLLKAVRFKQRGSGLYKSAGWNGAMLAKVDLVVKYCRRGKPFVYCDCDIRWYKPARKLSRFTQGCDIAAAHDGHGIFCAGFMAVANPAAALPFFMEVRRRMLVNPSDQLDDQDVINALLKEPSWKERIKIRLLPDEFWSFGLQTKHAGIKWEPGAPLQPPENIFLHHANCTEGQKNKLLMMEEVRKLHRRFKKRPLWAARLGQWMGLKARTFKGLAGN